VVGLNDGGETIAEFSGVSFASISTTGSAERAQRPLGQTDDCGCQRLGAASTRMERYGDGDDYSIGESWRFFYERYAAACYELGIAPLEYAALLALIEALAQRPAAALH